LKKNAKLPVRQSHNKFDTLVRLFGVRTLVLSDYAKQAIVNHVIIFVTVNGETQSLQLQRILYQNDVVEQCEHLLDLVEGRVVDVNQNLVDDIGAEGLIAVAACQYHVQGLCQLVMIDLLEGEDKLLQVAIGQGANQINLHLLRQLNQVLCVHWRLESNWM